MKIFFYMISLAVVLGACKAPENPENNLKGISSNSSAKNFGLIFGASNGLPGIDKDVRIMKDILQGSENEYGFEVVTDMDSSPREILDITKKHSAKLESDSTMFWYFSGHGGNGSLRASGGSLKMADVEKAMREVTKTTFKRLVIVIDTCNNGGLVNDDRIGFGRTDMNSGASLTGLTEEERHNAIAKEMAETTVQMFDQGENYSAEGNTKGRLFEELLIIVSSTASESSLAGGNGSAFTVSVSNAFKELRKQKDSTLGDFAELSKSKTIKRGGHRPQYKAYPSNLILGETLAPSDTPVLAGIFLKLGTLSNGGKIPLVATGSANAKKLVLCSGAEDDCKLSTATSFELPLATTQSIRGRTLFAGVKEFQITEGKVVTLSTFDASGLVLETTSLKFDKK